MTCLLISICYILGAMMHLMKGKLVRFLRFSKIDEISALLSYFLIGFYQFKQVSNIILSIKLLPIINMQEETDQQTDLLYNQKNIVCRYHLNGRCKFGQKCRFSHFIIECYLLRHAQSAFNQILSSFEHDASTNEAKQKYQLDQSFIDCGITQRGIKQIDEIGFPESLKNNQRIKFDIIFVSPLERCLRTLDRCTMTHKLKAKKIIVLPGLTEVLSKICDFGKSMKEKKARYQNFDFSFVKQDNEDEWQDELVDPEFRSQIISKELFGKRYVDILRRIFPQPLENSNRCFNRTLRTLQQIRQICLKEKANRILVVSHNRIIKYIMGRNNRGRSNSIQNCQIKYTVI